MLDPSTGKNSEQNLKSKINKHDKKGPPEAEHLPRLTEIYSDNLGLFISLFSPAEKACPDQLELFMKYFSAL